MVLLPHPVHRCFLCSTKFDLVAVIEISGHNTSILDFWLVLIKSNNLITLHSSPNGRSQQLISGCFSLMTNVVVIFPQSYPLPVTIDQAYFLTHIVFLAPVHIWVCGPLVSSASPSAALFLFSNCVWFFRFCFVFNESRDGNFVFKYNFPKSVRTLMGSNFTIQSLILII